MQRDRQERGWQGISLAAARQFERADRETSRQALPEGERLSRLGAPVSTAMPARCTPRRLRAWTKIQR
jgi:hypothetical protein